MAEQTEKINIIEILMTIKSDVSSIKTDMANFKETQQTEKDMILKEIADVRSDYKKDIADIESKFFSKVNNLQTVQNTLVGDVDTLKHKDDEKDAKKYRLIIAFMLTGLGGIVLGKLPDIVSIYLKARGN